MSGLGLDVKRQSIFNKFKSDNGVIMLQKNHSTSTNEKKWKKRFSHGTWMSRGVAKMQKSMVNG